MAVNHFFRKLIGRPHLDASGRWTWDFATAIRPASDWPVGGLAPTDRPSVDRLMNWVVGGLLLMSVAVLVFIQAQ
jgi:hypothetical protein